MLNLFVLATKLEKAWRTPGFHCFYTGRSNNFYSVIQCKCLFISYHPQNRSSRLFSCIDREPGETCVPLIYSSLFPLDPIQFKGVP